MLKLLPIVNSEIKHYQKWFDAKKGAFTSLVMIKADKDHEFPREIIFKTVFRTERCPRDSIVSCLSEKGLKYYITEKASSGAKFTSFTIAAFFESSF